ncbi:MAG: LysE family translocator [Hyphomicrobiaceae bacterium]|nr:LysE family translocator [Hyphomicrobiaceae bacterium]
MMDLASLLVFVSALGVAAASPGPGIAAIVARVLARGTSGAFAFAAGVALGDVVWLSVAVLGLAALAQAFAPVLVAIKYAGAAYLLYLAYRLWTAPVQVEEGSAQPEAREGTRLFLAGLSVTMGNPKVIVFYLALLPNLIDLGRLSLLGLVELSAVTLLVLAVVFGVYIALAARTRRLLRSARAMRLVNRGTGIVMASAAAAIAAR